MKKQCSKCKEVKPISDFSPDGKGKWKYSCKKCHAKYVSERLKIKKAEDAAIEAAKFTYPRIPDHMKQCKYCLEIKVKDGNYRRQAECAGGVVAKCNVCFNKDRPSRAGSEYSKKHWKKYYAENKDELLKKKKESDSRREYAKRRYQEKKDEIRRKQKEYNKTSRAKALNSRRQSHRARRIKEAQPSWLLPEHIQEMTNLYWLAQDLKAVSGVMYHVDHIVPLRGKNVCGLHVPWNLQVLPADVNIRKSNKMET
jgi:cytochrome c5